MSKRHLKFCLSKPNVWQSSLSHRILLSWATLSLCSISMLLVSHLHLPTLVTISCGRTKIVLTKIWIWPGHSPEHKCFSGFCLEGTQPSQWSLRTAPFLTFSDLFLSLSPISILLLSNLPFVAPVSRRCPYCSLCRSCSSIRLPEIYAYTSFKYSTEMPHLTSGHPWLAFVKHPGPHSLSCFSSFLFFLLSSPFPVLSYSFMWAHGGCL